MADLARPVLPEPIAAQLRESDDPEALTA